MPTLVLPLPTPPATTASPRQIDLDAADAAELVKSLAASAAESLPLQLLIDCRTLKCRRTLGVSHVVSQLLLLHRSGAVVWLRNVDTTLHRCLRLLGLAPLFPIAP